MKTTSSTIPCNIDVRPVDKASTLIIKASINKIIASELIPNASGKLVTIDTAETTGIVRPIDAKADPNDRLRLV